MGDSLEECWISNFGSGLGLVLLLITLKMFTFNHTQLKVFQDFENSMWWHLLNILNNITVEVLHLWSGMACHCQPMSGHHLCFRPSRKCSKLIISAALPPRSRACPAPQIRFDWPTRTLSLRPWRVFQIVIIYYYCDFHVSVKHGNMSSLFLFNVFV